MIWQNMYVLSAGLPMTKLLESLKKALHRVPHGRTCGRLDLSSLRSRKSDFEKQGETAASEERNKYLLLSRQQT